MSPITPTPQPRKRSRIRTFFYFVWGAIGLVVVIGIVSAVAATSQSTSTGTHLTTAAPSVPDSGTTQTPPTPPAANPDAKGSGSCDVSLSDALYGQDYLTADVDVDNTGNVGAVIGVTVRWPQQGFNPITRHRTVHVPAGQTRTVHLHAPVSSEQVSRFQDRQLASDGDPCHYRLDLLTTYGTVQS